MSHHHRAGANDSIHRAQGFTLLETLIALAISAIILSQAVPGFDRLFLSMHINGVTSSIERTLRLMRQESILRQRPTRICPSRDLETCTEGAQWSEGWIGYVDRGGGPERNQGDPLIMTQQALPRVRLAYNRGSPISTNARGRLTQNGTMRVCGRRDPRFNVDIIMVRSGRLRVAEASANCAT